MKFKDIANMSEADRKKKIVESKAELVKLNGQVATGTVPKSPGQIKQHKKTIAQILTLENQLKKTVAASSSSVVDSKKDNMEKK